MPDEDATSDDPKIIGSKTTLGSGSFAVDPEERDAISPTSIHHHVDELRADGKLIRHYNYFVYHFERADFSYQARAHVDFIHEVALLAPLDRSDSKRSDAEDAFRRDVLQYLKRRFNHIQELGMDGYVTVWERSDQ